MTQDLLRSWVDEDLDDVGLGGRAPDKIDEEGAVARTGMRLTTGLIYIAWELLAMREAEVGKTPAETLEELGRIFNPSGK